MSRLCKLCGQVEDQEHSLLNLRHHQESSNSILQQMKETDRTPYKYFRTYFFFKTCRTELAVAKDIKPFFCIGQPCLIPWGLGTRLAYLRLLL